MVRYRSRRDMLKMAIEIAGMGIDIHKWAALEKTQVFPVKPLLHSALIQLIVPALFLVLVLVLIALN
jgi:hypothetical protein